MDKVITNKKEIAVKYIQTYFFFDLITPIMLSIDIFYNNYTLIYNPENKIFKYFINLLMFGKGYSIFIKKK